MSKRILLCAVVLMVVACGIALADTTPVYPSSPADTTCTGTYSLANDEWTYTLTLDEWAVTDFYVFLGPNVESFDWLADISNDGGWTNPTTLDTVTDTGVWGANDWDGLKYLHWTASGSDTTVIFKFSDAHYDLGGGHYVDLINHPGPLLFDPISNANAWSTGWTDWDGVWEDYTSYAGSDTVANAITPEPTTMALFGLGLLGLARRVRRRVT